jgi:hypothetical protein
VLLKRSSSKRTIFRLKGRIWRLGINPLFIGNTYESEAARKNIKLKLHWYLRIFSKIKTLCDGLRKQCALRRLLKTN